MKRPVYSKVSESIPFAIQKTVLSHYDCAELPLKIYALLTLTLIIVELVATLVILIFAGQGADKYAYATQFLLVTVYFYMDLYYILYVVHLRFRLPAEYRVMVPLAFVGFG